MANINVSVTNTFEDWRVKTNELADAVGDIALLPITIDGAGYYNLIDALTETVENSIDISLLTTAIGDTNSGLIQSLADNLTQITINTADTAANTLAISANTSAIAAIEQVAVYNLSGTKLN
jgi:hypothetical protein